MCRPAASKWSRGSPPSPCSRRAPRRALSTRPPPGPATPTCAAVRPVYLHPDHQHPSGDPRIAPPQTDRRWPGDPRAELRVRFPPPGHVHDGEGGRRPAAGGRQQVRVPRRAGCRDRPRRPGEAVLTRATSVSATRRSISCARRRCGLRSGRAGRPAPRPPRWCCGNARCGRTACQPGSPPSVANSTRTPTSRRLGAR